MNQDEIINLLKEELYTEPHDYLPDTQIIAGVDAAAKRIAEAFEPMEEVLEHLAIALRNVAENEAVITPGEATILLANIQTATTASIKPGELKPGDYVTYCGPYKTPQRGRVKALAEHTQDSVFVVYNCAGEWDRFTDYTGQLTALTDLKRGWR